MRNTRMVLARCASASIKTATIAATMLASIFVAAQPAQADDRVTPMYIPCDNKGQSWYSVYNVVKPKKITHAERYYNGSGANMTAKFTAVKRTTLTASVTVSSGVTVEASAVIGKLSATANVSLAASGSVTYGYDVGIDATLAPYKYMVVYRGNVEVSGNYKYYHCNSSGALITRSSGTGKSFSVAETGPQRCDLSAPSGSMAALAKNNYC